MKCRHCKGTGEIAPGTLAQRIVALRGATSMRDSAALAGVSAATWSRIEAGNPPSVENLVKIADHFDVTTDELLGRSLSRSPEK